MPGNVSAPSFGSPVRVMPKILASAFQEAREYYGVLNLYADGSRQAAAINTNSVRRFQFTNRDQTDGLLDFFEATGHKPFYFYNPKLLVHDPTGVNTTGRFGCVFEGNFTDVLDMIATQQVFIVEVA